MGTAGQVEEGTVSGWDAGREKERGEVGSGALGLEERLGLGGPHGRERREGERGGRCARDMGRWTWGWVGIEAR